MKKKPIIKTLIIICFIISVLFFFATYYLWSFTGSRYFETMTGLDFPYQEGTFLELETSFMIFDSYAYMKIELEELNDFVTQNEFKLMNESDWKNCSKIFSSKRFPPFPANNGKLFMLNGKNKYGYPYTWWCAINKGDAFCWIRIAQPDASGD